MREVAIITCLTRCFSLEERIGFTLPIAVSMNFTVMPKKRGHSILDRNQTRLTYKNFHLSRSSFSCLNCNKMITCQHDEMFHGENCREEKVDLHFKYMPEQIMYILLTYLRLEEMTALMICCPNILTLHGLADLWCFKFGKHCPTFSWLRANHHALVTIDYFIICLNQGLEYNFHNVSYRYFYVYSKNWRFVKRDRRGVIWNWNTVMRHNQSMLIYWRCPEFDPGLLERLRASRSSSRTTDPHDIVEISDDETSFIQTKKVEGIMFFQQDD